jgi:hypothetical protein
MSAITWKTKSVTKALQDLAMEAHDSAPDGTPLSKAQCLARLIWNKALGYKKMVVPKDGPPAEIEFPAEAWAINLVLDRLEGKLGPGVAEESAKTPIVDKVSDLAKRRINSLVVDGVTKPKKGPPPIE